MPGLRRRCRLRPATGIAPESAIFPRVEVGGRALRHVCDEAWRGVSVLVVRPHLDTIAVVMAAAHRTVLRGWLMTAAALLCACGGAAKPAHTGTGSGESSQSVESTEETPSGPVGPDCSDGTCFACGSGLCPTGWYCDEKASAGPSCSWLPECAASSTCQCLTRQLGAACRCEEREGGPHLSCG